MRDDCEERVLGGGRMPQHERALTKILQRQTGKGDRQPGRADRTFSEVAHVGVQRLGARHRQEHAAQNDETQEPVADQQVDAIIGTDSAQDLRGLDDLAHAEDRQHQEPDHHDGAEIAADAGGAARLGHEQADQDRSRQRQDNRSEQVAKTRRVAQQLNRGQHGHRRGDEAITIEQRRATDPEHEDEQRPSAERPLRQRHQRQRAAFALVVGTHDENDVLDRHDDDQGPEHQRDDAKDRRLTDPAANVRERGPHGVERAGADIAEHDAKRPER